MITYEQQLTALDESIAHWQRLASGNRLPDESIGMSHCALCKLVDPDTNDCGQCPIAIVNPSNEWCKDTPYDDTDAATVSYTKASGSYEDLDSPAFLAAAQRELEFLQQVREQFVKCYEKHHLVRCHR